MSGKNSKKNWEIDKVLRAVDKWGENNLIRDINNITVELASDVFTFPKNDGLSLARVIEYAQRNGMWNSAEFQFVKPYIMTALKTGIPLHCFINAVTTEKNVELYVIGCEVSAFISGRSLEDIIDRVLIHEDLHASGMEEAEIRAILDPLKFSILAKDETTVMDLAVH